MTLRKSKTALFLFAAAIISLIISLESLHAQTAREYYTQGLELKKQNQTEAAIKAFTKAVEKDREFAEAWYEMALLLHSKNTPTSLVRAEEAMLKAKKYGGDDVKYLSVLALFYEDRNYYSLAKSTWERVLKIEPEYIDALGGIARFHAREANEYKYRVDPYATGGNDLYFYDQNFVKYARDYNNIEFGESVLTLGRLRLEKEVELMPPLRFDEFVVSDDITARALYDEILSIDPANRDALYRKGLLYYDRVKYQSAYESGDLYDGYRTDTEYLDDFAAIFEEFIARYPDDKDGYLFLGLAYNRMHDYDLAWEHFMTARNLMTEEEREIFSNIGYLKEGGLQETEFYSSQSDTSKFWYQRDPLYLSPYNERELEHYSRLAEANLRFSNLRKGIEGWQTEQGKILIKYGAPENRVKYLNSMQYFDSENIEFMRTKEFWHYENFAFVFEKNLGQDISDFKLAIWGGFNFPEISVDIEKEYPEYYEYEPKGTFIDFVYDYATFRGDDDKTRVEVYYGVPFNRVHFKKEEEYLYSSLKTGVFLHDRDWNRVIGDIQDIDMQYNITEVDTSSDDLSVDRFVYQVDPGWYHFAIEMMDWYSDNVGTYRDSIGIEAYGYENLQMSDIQLAWDIEFIKKDTAATRSNLEIQPNPRRFYKSNQPIFIYFEVYNLFLDGVPGNNNYTVEYSIEFAGEEKYTVMEYITSVFLNEKLYGEVTTTFTNRGSNRDEPLFLQIDHSLTKAGPYRLAIKITDNISGTSVEKSTLLRIFDAK